MIQQKQINKRKGDDDDEDSLDIPHKINFSVQQQDSVLISDFMSDEDVQEETTKTGNSKPNYESLNDSRISTTSLLEKAEGARYRAYSLSKDSTKAFEKSISKKRAGCTHCCSRFKAFFYSLYLGLLQHTSSPPTRGNFGLYLLLSFLISADLIITMNFVFHLALPIWNLVVIGIPFLCVYPLLPILSPLFGIFGVILKFINLYSASSVQQMQ